MTTTKPEVDVQGEPVAWSGWGCQYPGKMPRLYGDRRIAELNCDWENGDQVLHFTATPQPAEQQPDMDQLGGFLAWLDAFVAVSEQAGIDGHEEAWTWPAPPTDPGFFDSYPKLTAGDLRAVHAALAAHRKGGQP